MDFRQITQPSGNRPAASAPEEPERRAEKPSGKKVKTSTWAQLFNGVMLIGIAVLVAAVVVVLTRSNTKAAVAENTFVASSNYQAVFLSNGQVYFGKVTSLNSDYIRMKSVYYLTQNGESSTSDYTLIKLGCQQIHYPEDAMTINRAQVTFWENLNDKGTVVSKIKEFEKTNPNGPDCTQVSNQTQADSNASTQGSTKK